MHPFNRSVRKVGHLFTCLLLSVHHLILVGHLHELGLVHVLGSIILTSQELDIELKVGVLRDARLHDIAVRHACGAGKKCLLADLELLDALIPALDDLGLTEHEGESFL